MSTTNSDTGSHEIVRQDEVPDPPDFSSDPPPPMAHTRSSHDSHEAPPMRTTPYVPQQPHDLRAQAVQDLQDWLVRTLDGALPEILRKADEYGSGDLEMMGERQAKMLNLPPDVGMEASTAFYLDGKVARILSAVEMGRRPSADSWFDAFVYGLIGLRINQTGKWL